MYIFFVFFLFLFNLIWTAGLDSWIVDYRTTLVQATLWVSLISLISFSFLWTSAKTRNPFTNIRVQTYYSSIFSK